MDMTHNSSRGAHYLEHGVGERCRRKGVPLLLKAQMPLESSLLFTVEIEKIVKGT
jgi:hypothetical protein